MLYKSHHDYHFTCPGKLVVSLIISHALDLCSFSHYHYHMQWENNGIMWLAHHTFNLTLGLEVRGSVV